MQWESQAAPFLLQLQPWCWDSGGHMRSQLRQLAQLAGQPHECGWDGDSCSLWQQHRYMPRYNSLQRVLSFIGGNSLSRMVVSGKSSFKSINCFSCVGSQAIGSFWSVFFLSFFQKQSVQTESWELGGNGAEPFHWRLAGSRQVRESGPAALLLKLPLKSRGHLITNDPSLKVKAIMIFWLFQSLSEFSVNQAQMLNKAEFANMFTQLLALWAVGTLKKTNATHTRWNLHALFCSELLCLLLAAEESR